MAPRRLNNLYAAPGCVLVSSPAGRAPSFVFVLEQEVTLVPATHRDHPLARGRALDAGDLVFCTTIPELSLVLDGKELHVFRFEDVLGCAPASMLDALGEPPLAMPSGGVPLQAPPVPLDKAPAKPKEPKP